MHPLVSVSASIVLAVLACDDSRFVRNTSGATGPGPDFNGGFDRRPMKSNPLSDGGVLVDFPTSIPDGWSMESGTWNVGVYALYGEGYGGGAPLMCGSSPEEHICPGTGSVPNNSALAVSVCWPYNGGCSGSNILRSATFPVVGGASYALSVMARGGFEYIATPQPPITSVVVFHLEWLSGAASVGVSDLVFDMPLTQTWQEWRAGAQAPSNASSALIRIELPRAKRDVRMDNLALLPQ